MDHFLHYFLLLPVLGFVVTMLLPEKMEKTLSNVAFVTVLLQLVGLIVFIIAWIFNGFPELNLNEISLFKTDHYEFFIDFYFDKVSAVYLFIGTVLTVMIAKYSRYYLHREKGYKRFFNTILFFYVGYNIATLSGNFETLFMGWEIIGISSFLLIAFYRERYLPVKNAFKVYSIYRIGDLGFILAMWASHHLFHENITFIKLNNYELVNEHLQSHTFIGFFIAICLACAAAAKSAQIPFSTWLPRAMEGPTPSSAIFYGSLSVHLGVFLMLRTFPFWEHQTSARIAIGLMGLFTSIMASLMARVQSTVKSQVAYSSIAQIGLIFIEVALGLDWLALIHFTGNAFLRTYQLLVSPSVVSYLIREQFYTFQPKDATRKSFFSKRIQYSIYILSLKEFNLEYFLNNILWKPLKIVGKMLDFINLKRVYLLFIPLFFLGILSLVYKENVPSQLLPYLPELYAFFGLIFVFKAFSERKSPFLAWTLIVLSHFWISLAIAFNDKMGINEIIFYLSGIVVSGLIGYFSLLKLKSLEKRVLISQYLGHVYEHPKFAFLFLLATLGITGFPITTTFIGEDLLYSHIESNQFFLAFFVSLSFVVSGISGIRIYARLFLGPHVKTYHSSPYKSS